MTHVIIAMNPRSSSADMGLPYLTTLYYIGVVWRFNVGIYGIHGVLGIIYDII